MIKPKIKNIKGQYQCCRWLAGGYVGCGNTPQEAYKQWHNMNEAPDSFHLAA